MSAGDIFHDSATRVRPAAATDRAGNRVDDWSDDAVTELDIDRITIQPADTSETPSDDGILATNSYTIISEPGHQPDIRDTDRIDWRGDRYTIVGEIARWPDPFGEDFIRLTMRRIRGR